MPQAVWSGSLSFGLVAVPVRLFPATSSRDVRFRQLERGTARPIRYRRVANEPSEVGWEPAAAEPGVGGGRSPVPGSPDGEDGRPGVGPAGPAPVPPPTAPDPQVREPSRSGPPSRSEPPHEVEYGDVVKGFELEPGRFVVLDPEEVRALAPSRTGRVEIEDFVRLEDIDPVHFERAYLIAPRPEGEKPYWLLRQAMLDEATVGVARFVLRTREHLAAIRPVPGALALHTLFRADEVRSPAEVGIGTPGDAGGRELDIARRLLRTMATDWDPAGYPDTYRERLLETIRERAGEAVISPAPDDAEAPAIPDLMEALKASLEAIRREPSRRPAAGGGRPRARRPRKAASS